MTLPAYPGRRSAPSYEGRYVPAECPDGHRAYVAPLSVTDSSQGYCSRCGCLVEWDRWRDEPISRRVGE